MTLKKSFDFWISKGSFIHADSGQAELRTGLLRIESHNSGHAHHREVPMTQNKLLKCPSSRGRKGREFDFHQHFRGFKDSGHHGDEKILGRDGSFSLGTANFHLGIQSFGYGAQFGCGIGVNKTSSHRTAIADLRMSDQLGSVRQQPALGANDLRGLQRSLPSHGTNGQGAIVFTDIIQILDPIDVNQNLGTSQPKVEQGYQALTAGQNLGIFTVFLQ